MGWKVASTGSKRRNYYQDAKGRWHRPGNGGYASNKEMGIYSDVNNKSSSHGNSLSNTDTNYGYALIDKDTKEILKFGETLNPDTRYSDAYMNEHNAEMVIMEQGSKKDIHYWQHDMNNYFKDKYGKFPRLVKSKNGW